MESSVGSTPIRLLLSGGGHRAVVSPLGAIAYLAQCDRWSDVCEIVSVSGGSITNAALASAEADDDVWRILSTVLTRIDDDRGRVWANGRRLLVIARYALAALFFFGLVIVALGFGPSVPRVVSFAIGMVAIPVFLRIGGLCANSILRDFISVVSGRTAVALDSDHQRARAHVFCASGLSSGTPYLLWTGRPFDEGDEPSWGAALQAPYSVIDAAVASVSLPFLGRVRSPKEPGDSLALHGGEILVDGGVSGIFGEQFGTPFFRTPADTYRSGDKQLIAIDAGRHTSSPRELARTLERFSVTATLFRWLKASLEATYVNDLVDLAPETLVRVCESDDMLADASDAASLNPMSPTMALRLGALPEPTVDDDARLRLAAVRSQVSKISLVNLNAQRIDMAFVAGFVATMLKFEPSATAEHIAAALRLAETELACADRFSLVWAGLG